MTAVMTRVAPERLTDPLVVGPGLVPAMVVFVLVVAAVMADENAT